MQNIILQDKLLLWSIIRKSKLNGCLIEITIAPARNDSLWRAVGINESASIAAQLKQGKKFVFRVTGIGKAPVIVDSEELFD